MESYPLPVLPSERGTMWTQAPYAAYTPPGPRTGPPRWSATLRRASAPLEFLTVKPCSRLLFRPDSGNKYVETARIDVFTDRPTVSHHQIKETQQAVKDSETGLEKMSIAHHIQDRGHVVERKYNKKTGEKELSQDFNNMDESEAQSFDDEWQQEVSKFRPLGPMLGLEEPGPRGVRQAALPGAEQEPSDQSKGKAEGQSNTNGSASTKQ